MFQLLLKEVSISSLVSELQPTCTLRALLQFTESCGVAAELTWLHHFEACLKQFPWDFGLRTQTLFPERHVIPVKRRGLFSTMAKCVR